MCGRAAVSPRDEGAAWRRRVSSRGRRARALREFGDVDRASDAIAGSTGRPNSIAASFASPASSVRTFLYGLRLLVRSKSFTVTAIVTLALAIGGNVAIFSVVNALFLQPLPIRDPDTLARIYTGESRV